MGNKFPYKLNYYESSFPSRTRALQELSTSVVRLGPQHLPRHMIALNRRAKPILVRMYVIASKYDSSSFSAILLAGCFIVRVADSHSTPDRKRGAQGSYTSRSSIRCSYFTLSNAS